MPLISKNQVIPQVSVIVVNWNGKPLLNDCLVPLLRQTHAACELILVDNGSSDGSVDWVRTEFSQINLVQLSSNQGFTGGNLAGLDAAHGEFIALVNNDTRADERCLSELLLPMIRDSQVGISAAKLLLDRTEMINSAGVALTTAAVGFDRGYGEDCSLYDVPEHVFGACAAAVLYRYRGLHRRILLATSVRSAWPSGQDHCAAIRKTVRKTAEE